MVALKLEPINRTHTLVIYEANVTLLLHGVTDAQRREYNNLNVSVQNAAGISKIYGFGKHENKAFYMAMELLGPTLSSLFNFCGYKFSLSTTVKLAF